MKFDHKVIHIQIQLSLHIYASEVKESIRVIPNELPCVGDFENPGQRKYSDVLIILFHRFS